MKYIQVSGNQRSPAYCSDNACPCPGLGAEIPHGQGYMYISKDVADFRQDALSESEAERKIKSLATSGNFTMFDASVFSPTLMCELGAKKRQLDLEMAASDAKHWWNTGEVPCRPTSIKGEEDSSIGSDEDASKLLSDADDVVADLNALLGKEGDLDTDALQAINDRMDTLVKDAGAYVANDSLSAAFKEILEQFRETESGINELFASSDWEDNHYNLVDLYTEKLGLLAEYAEEVLEGEELEMALTRYHNILTEFKNKLEVLEKDIESDLADAKRDESKNVSSGDPKPKSNKTVVWGGVLLLIIAVWFLYNRAENNAKEYEALLKEMNETERSIESDTEQNAQTIEFLGYWNWYIENPQTQGVSVGFQNNSTKPVKAFKGTIASLDDFGDPTDNRIDFLFDSKSIYRGVDESGAFYSTLHYVIPPGEKLFITQIASGAGVVGYVSSEFIDVFYDYYIKVGDGFEVTSYNYLNNITASPKDIELRIEKVLYDE